MPQDFEIFGYNDDVADAVGGLYGELLNTSDALTDGGTIFSLISEYMENHDGLANQVDGILDGIEMLDPAHPAHVIAIKEIHDLVVEQLVSEDPQDQTVADQIQAALENADIWDPVFEEESRNELGPIDPDDGDGDGGDGDGDGGWNPPPIDPLVLDLDGDGIELSSLNSSTAYFDLNSDGFAEKTAWVSADDALLVIDHNGNGQIDNGSELFGDTAEFANGFENLADYDTNADGVIDSSDDQFSDLLIWQDANQDGVSNSSEMMTLTDAGIASISLSSSEVDQSNAGNQVSDISSYTTIDGETHEIADVWFERDTRDTKVIVDDDFTINENAAWLPHLAGSGTIAHSVVALSNDTALRQSAHDLLDMLNDGNVSGFRNAFDAFAFDWAGVSNVDPAGRGAHIDGQQLAFLEQYYGSGFVQVHAGTGQEFSNPNAEAAAGLESLFQEKMDAFALAFLVQTAGSTAALSSETLSQALDLHHEHELSSLTSLATSYLENGDFDATNENSVKLIVTDLVNSGLLTDIDATWILQTAISANEYSVTSGTEASENLSVADFDGLNVIIAGKGDDTITGSAGGEEYLYSIGDGSDTITDLDGGTQSGSDTLAFLDLSSVDATFAQSSNENLIITLTDGETVTVTDHFAEDGDNSIETITFADGTVLDAQGIRNRSVSDMKTSGVVVGSDFAETYYHSLGDGSYTIYDWDFRGRTDTLVFTDLNATDVSFSSTFDEHLIITASDGAEITVFKHFTEDLDEAIEQIQFADGSMLDLQGIQNKSVADQKASGTVVGSDFAETYYHSLGDGSYDKPIRIFSGVDEILAEFQIPYDDGSLPARIDLNLWVNGSGPRPEIERVALNPQECGGHRWRERSGSVGFIQFYLNRVSDERLMYSQTNTVSEPRMGAVEGLYTGYDGSIWDVRKANRISSKLNRMIRKKAVAKISTSPILPGAAMLWEEGLDFGHHWSKTKTPNLFADI